MKLKSVKIENYRAINKLEMLLDPSLTVFHGANGCGKTSVLSAIAVGVGETIRCYFGSLGERVLARQPQPWI